jgi:molybdenum cofactor cytidylyltransferase
MRVVGVVPAAGRSSRMGNPKPLLDADGRSFLARVVAALREGGTADVFVGVREEKGPISAEARKAGARLLVPGDVEDGPVATVRAAIHQVEGSDPPIDGFLLHPADHPLVAPATVERLLEAAAEGRSAIVAPVHRGESGHPVFFHRSLFPELLEPDLEEGARSVVRRHREASLEIPVEDAGVLADINTLAEYRRHFPDSYRKRFQKW